jgi:predicted TIM-barrel fold metal-dependent hydrolase
MYLDNNATAAKDKFITLGGLNTNDSDHDSKEPMEEKIKQLETLKWKCNNRHEEFKERQERIRLVIRIIFKMKHQNK